MDMGAAAAGRKRKAYSEESEVSASSIQLKTRRLGEATVGNSATPANSGSVSCETVGVDDALATSCCSSNGSSEVAKEASKFLDLEDNEATVEFLKTSSAGDTLDFGERRETTPFREAEGESVELETTARQREPDPRRRSTQVKTPSEAELEEFFTAAEKNLHQKFIDKYNYDIAKDQPLEGRYEWAEITVRPEN